MEEEEHKKINSNQREHKREEFRLKHQIFYPIKKIIKNKFKFPTNKKNFCLKEKKAIQKQKAKKKLLSHLKKWKILNKIIPKILIKASKIRIQLTFI